MHKKIFSLLALLYTWMKSAIIKPCEVQWLLSISSVLTLEYVAFSTNPGFVSEMNLKKKNPDIQQIWYHAFEHTDNNYVTKIQFSI